MMPYSLGASCLYAQEHWRNVIEKMYLAPHQYRLIALLWDIFVQKRKTINAQVCVTARQLQQLQDIHSSPAVLCARKPGDVISEELSLTAKLNYLVLRDK